MKLRTFLTAILLAATLTLATATSIQARLEPPHTHIAMIDYAFEPAEQTITTGESITWQNDGQELHNVFELGGTWESPALSNGQTYTFTFGTPGTYNYVCSIHSGMLGTIIVVEPQPPPKVKVYIVTI